MKMKRLILFLTLFIITLGYSQNVTVDKLTIKTIKANPNNAQILTRNSSTGVMEYIPKDSISGGGVTYEKTITGWVSFSMTVVP